MITSANTSQWGRRAARLTDARPRARGRWPCCGAGKQPRRRGEVRAVALGRPAASYHSELQRHRRGDHGGTDHHPSPGQALAHELQVSSRRRSAAAQRTYEFTREAARRRVARRAPSLAAPRGPRWSFTSIARIPSAMIRLLIGLARLRPDRSPLPQDLRAGDESRVPSPYRLEFVHGLHRRRRTHEAGIRLVLRGGARLAHRARLGSRVSPDLR